MIASKTLRNSLNFILFQLGWFVCVLYPGPIGALSALGLVAVHFLLVSQSRYAELQFIGLGTVVGSALDGLWLNTGILSDGQDQAVLTPPWLVGIWALFMTTLSHSLDWISRKAWLPFVLAPVAGPFAYWSASQLGAVELPHLLPSLIALAVGGLVVFPALLFARRSLYPELLT